MTVSYGKAAVTVYRTDGQRTLFGAELQLEVLDDGVLPAYTTGDNSLVVPTDTMKNFIHTTALDYPGTSLEELLDLVGRKFLSTYRHFSTIRLRAREVPFARQSAALFRRLYDDYGIAEMTLTRTGIGEYRSGREALHLVKLTGSSFAQFYRDAYTTLPEMADRPLLVHLNVYWRAQEFLDYVDGAVVREVLCETFDAFVSKSIQHLVYEMGQRLLARFPRLLDVSFEAENHLWDTAQTLQADPRVKVYTEPRPPYGVIGYTVKR